jgi:hypothetical protein
MVSSTEKSMSKIHHWHLHIAQQGGKVSESLLRYQFQKAALSTKDINDLPTDN